jgi:hypothetical protein
MKGVASAFKLHRRPANPGPASLAWRTSRSSAQAPEKTCFTAVASLWHRETPANAPAGLDPSRHTQLAWAVVLTPKRACGSALAIAPIIRLARPGFGQSCSCCCTGLLCSSLCGSGGAELKVGVVAGDDQSPPDDVEGRLRPVPLLPCQSRRPRTPESSSATRCAGKKAASAWTPSLPHTSQETGRAGGISKGPRC